MMIRRLRMPLTRLFLTGVMVATVAVGAVAVVTPHEAAARSRNCAMYLASAQANRNTGDVYRSLGWYDQANEYYARADMYYGIYETYC